MGNSRWTADTMTAYASAASLRSSHSLHDTFVYKETQKSMDPVAVKVRESRDSQANPESTAIIIGLDVTGSMGIIAFDMAKRSLGILMKEIHQIKPVTDPHIMIMGIGDIAYDKSPLQTSQFEADIRIDNELQKLYMEGGGGGNATESYDLAWWFAARKTSIDCWEKRGKKGYLFTIGDELPPTSISSHHFKKVGETDAAPNTVSLSLLHEAQKTYTVFHIIVEEGDYAQRDPNVVSAWREILGKRAIPLNNYKCLPAVILACMAVNDGMEPEDVIGKVTDTKDIKAIRHAFGLKKEQ